MSAQRNAQVLVVLVTCPTQRSASRLANVLVKEGLAACVNILPRIQSVFRWKGKVDRASESLLVIKTTSQRFPALRRAVCAHHPYEIPEIIALPIVKGFPPYLAWIRNSVS